MRKIESIILGWWYLITNRGWSPLVYRRLKICSSCQYRKWFVCGECGCVLKAKARLPEEQCPKGFWDKFMDLI